ncbi:MAG TPA: Ni/Fe hydrogenase subunit beta, partial [Thermoplasmata archaeon]|nr:Ni/Fe hydrogenase subunit beta [Thermoplasmata archaeon]
MKQIVKTITKKDFSTFVNTLIKDGSYDVVGVQAKGKCYVFDTLSSAEELRLNYDVTILPPKKYFLPQYEMLLKFSLQKPYEAKETITDSPRIIIGVHPYDIIALEQTDRHYFDQQQDNFYKKRRENTLIIGVDIQNVSERSFAASMNTNTTETGFDLLLTDIGTSYAVTIGSE